MKRLAVLTAVVAAMSAGVAAIPVSASAAPPSNTHRQPKPPAPPANAPTLPSRVTVTTTSNTYLGSGEVQTPTPTRTIEVYNCEPDYCEYSFYHWAASNSLDYDIWCTNSCGSADRYWAHWNRERFDLTIYYGADADFQWQAFDEDQHLEWIHHQDDMYEQSTKSGDNNDSCAYSSEDTVWCRYTTNGADESYWDPGVQGQAIVYGANGASGWNSYAWIVATNNFGN